MRVGISTLYLYKDHWNSEQKQFFISLEDWKWLLVPYSQFDQGLQRGGTLIRSTEIPIVNSIIPIYSIDINLSFLIDLILTEWSNGNAVLTKSFISPESPPPSKEQVMKHTDGEVADLAMADNQGLARQNSDELDESSLHYAERSHVGSNCTRPDGGGLVGECGRVFEASIPPQQKQQLTQASTQSISQMTLPPENVSERVPAG